MGYLSCKAESSVSVSSPSKTTPSHPTNPIKIQTFQYSDLQAATNNFSDQKLLGKGSHGSVYKAVLRGGRPVAVKKSSTALAPRLSASSVNEVDNEIDILSKLQSPRLVNLVGFTTHDRYKGRLLVVEFMSNGTLYDLLHSNSRPPTWGRRLRLALQTANAIDTLHSSSPPVIHRDIKSANILIDRNFNARLGDFGLALRCQLDDFRLKSTPPAGTMGYLDPAYVAPDNLSTKSDVFSFGILLLEIISGRKAIDMGYSPPSIVDWAIPLIRKGKISAVYDPRLPPLKDAIVRKQLAVIAAKCVRTCRERRPTMKEVADWLGGLSKLVPLHSWNGLNNPCLMVENVARPTEMKNIHRMMNGGSYDAADENLARATMRNSRRVYSDLGFSNNLMELMAETNEGSEVQGKGRAIERVSGSPSWSASLRFGSERDSGKGRSKSNLRRNGILINFGNSGGKLETTPRVVSILS